MTTVIRVRNVNHAFIEGLWHLKTAGVIEDSRNGRNGRVVVAPGPVVTEYLQPMERVLFHEKRDANPVFHLMESIWMLAGADNADFLLPFNSGMARYTEPDGVMHGAYGYRWRNQFARDQLLEIVEELKRDPTTRQAVLTMWDPVADLNRPQFKDRPCNTHAYFDLRGGHLNMTVLCRSNDVVWGAYGANVVHFSVLQEWLAAMVGAPVGVYRQVSNNFHLYLDNPQCAALLADVEATTPTPDYPPHERLCNAETAEAFLDDCAKLVFQHDADELLVHDYETPFFREVAVPLHNAYMDRKGGYPIMWKTIAECDWKYAFQQWVARRDATKEQA